jgi:hypothetical protein
MSSERKTLKVVFFMPGLRATRQLVSFCELSNDVDTTGTGSMLVVASRVVTAIQRRFRTQYGRQLPSWKSISTIDH